MVLGEITPKQKTVNVAWPLLWQPLEIGGYRTTKAIRSRSANPCCQPHSNEKMQSSRDRLIDVRPYYLKIIESSGLARISGKSIQIIEFLSFL
jgi:hypothetical protein